MPPHHATNNRMTSERMLEALAKAMEFVDAYDRTIRALRLALTESNPTLSLQMFTDVAIATLPLDSAIIRHEHWVLMNNAQKNARQRRYNERKRLREYTMGFEAYEQEQAALARQVATPSPRPPIPTPSHQPNVPFTSLREIEQHDHRAKYPPEFFDPNYNGMAPPSVPLATGLKPHKSESESESNPPSGPSDPEAPYGRDELGYPLGAPVIRDDGEAREVTQSVPFPANGRFTFG